MQNKLKTTKFNRQIKRHRSKETRKQKSAYPNQKDPALKQWFKGFLQKAVPVKIAKFTGKDLQ